jgi:lysophospholipase L1-like esterase
MPISDTMKSNFLLSALLALPGLVPAAVAPMKRISLQKTVFASPTSNAGALTDGKFGSPWSYGASTWAAIQVGTGPTQVLVAWNDPTGNWSDSVPSAGVCQKGTTFPTGYRILTSANSTTGSDGTWTPQVVVTKNVVSARAHLAPFDGASWIKIEVTGGTGSMDEIEVFDATGGLTDSWFFLGTSISQMTYKSFLPDSTFSDLVHARVPANTPAMVRGGVPCISSTNVVNSLPRYLDLMTGVRYVAVELGTNDGYNNGSSNLATFKKNLQTLVDSIRGRGMEPVLARVLSTNPAKANWQIDPGYPLAVDTLRTRNNLVAGPDLNGWFLQHPDELGSDGIHPNATGAQSIQRLWAEAMAKNLYGADVAGLSPRTRWTTSGSGTRTTDLLGRAGTPSASGIGIHLDPARTAIERDVSVK